MAKQHSERPLHKLKVLVTRPRQRSAGLCRMIEQAGGEALQFAAIEISEPVNKQRRLYVREHIDKFDIAIFISPTAVERTFEYLEALAPATRVCAIGSRTAAALQAIGLDIDIRPEGHDSESLLQHPQLQQPLIDGCKIVIFKGEGGRELLGDTLRTRGAEVVYADMYRRSAPTSRAQLDQLLAETDVITVSSNQGLQNLFDLAGDRDGLLARVLVVPGERASTLAKELGFSKILIADNATDEACINALKYAFS